MQHRSRSQAIAGFVALLSFWAISANAQTAPARAQVSPGSVIRAQRAVDKTAADRKIVLTDAARRELAVEVVRQQAAAPTPDPAAPEPAPDASVDHLLKQMEFAKPGAEGGALDVDRVRQFVANDKAAQVRATLAQDVSEQATAAGLTLPDDVRTMLIADLEKQTTGLAASGLPVEVIRAKNATFFKAVAEGLQGQPITGTTYTQMQLQIFRRYVDLRIESVPSGAHVRMNDVELGVTDVPRQPLEPGKTYRFEFALPGYRTATRPYFVAAGETTALLREPLVPDSDVDTPGGPADTPPTSRGTSFPYLLVIVGVVLLVALVFLARR